MATIYGQSQAWQAVVTKLDLTAYSVNSPQELHELHDRLKCKQPEWQVRAEQIVRDRITALQVQFRAFPDRIAQQKRAARVQIEPTIAYLLWKYRILTDDSHFLRRLLNKWFVVSRLKNSLSQARAALANAAHSLLMAQQSVAREIAVAEASFPHTVAALVRNETNTLTRVKLALGSPEFAGAIMELEVARILATLPNTFHVFHDLKIARRRHIRFQGTWLKSAQIDHIVIGPTGVFIIETKNWSRDFIDHGEYFDPFRQVARARFLCQCHLRDMGFRGLVVRDILANAGAHLDKPQGSYTRILRPSALNAHIQNRPSEFPQDTVECIASRLRNRRA